MHAVTDYMFSLPGGLLNKNYDLEKCVDFLMEREDIYLRKPLHRYNRKLVRDVIHFLVSPLAPWPRIPVSQACLTRMNVCSAQASTRCKASRIKLTRR